MSQQLAAARRIIQRWDKRLCTELPIGAAIFDAHLHVGHDVDGMSSDAAELIRVMDTYGVHSGFVFCMNEADREPGFRTPNDRTLALAEGSDGRFIPFARLDLDEDPVGEAKRCLARGARGIKLHPRAQSFGIGDERLRPILGLAEDYGVPILLHGGRGLPPIADHLADLHEMHPDAQLIVAHAGIADLPTLSRRLAGRPGVFFDTSVWSVPDLLTCMHLVSPEQLLYASDYPYLQQPGSLLLAVRAARLSGADDTAVRFMLSGNALGIIRRLPPRAPTLPARASCFSQPTVFARISDYITMAVALFRADQTDQAGALDLAAAAAACDTQFGVELAELRELLLVCRNLWQELPTLRDAEQYSSSRMTSRLLHLASVVSATTALSPVTRGEN